MLDSNTYYLNQYEHNQSILEEQWEITLKDKQDEAIDLAVKLLTLDCNQELFCWVFCEYLNEEENDVDAFYNKLEELSTSKGYLTIEGIGEIARTALEGACESLFDTEFDVIFENQSDWCVVNELFKRIMNNGN